MAIHGFYDGDRYVIHAFETDPRTHPSKPTRGYRVQRTKGEPHNVLTGNPPDCDCFDFLKRDGVTPVPCRHVLAARKILSEHGSK